MPVPDVWPKDIFKSFKIMPTKHLSNAFKNLSKIAKGTWKAMGTAAKEIKTATSLFAAFGSESLITKVFDKVIGNYTTYLSDTFWGEVVKGIDFDVVTTVITDILGPVFTAVGTWIGDKIEQAPIGTAIGGSLGYLIGSFVGHPGIGAAIGASLGFLIEEIGKSFTRTEFRDTLEDAIDKGYTIYGAPPDIPFPTPDYDLYRYERYNLPEYQLGTSYVPRTGPAMVHRGEEIIPPNRRGSRGEITINIDLRNAVVDNVDRLSQKIAEQVMIRIG